MNHKFILSTYQEIEDFMGDLVYRICKNCNMQTYHLKCGYEGINYRLECLNCGSEI